ncbi:hypothetical protein RFI_23581, partial [Reticulomyxa filosa]
QSINPVAKNQKGKREMRRCFGCPSPQTLEDDNEFEVASIDEDEKGGQPPRSRGSRVSRNSVSAIKSEKDMKRETTNKFTQRETKESVWIDLPRLIHRFKLQEDSKTRENDPPVQYITPEYWKTYKIDSFQTAVQNYRNKSNGQKLDNGEASSHAGVLQTKLNDAIENGGSFAGSYSRVSVVGDNVGLMSSSAMNALDMNHLDNESKPATQDLNEKWHRWCRICHFLNILAKICDTKIQGRYRGGSLSRNTLSNQTKQKVESLLKKKLEEITDQFLIRAANETSKSSNNERIDIERVSGPRRGEEFQKKKLYQTKKKVIRHFESLELADIPSLLKSTFESEELLKNSLMLSILCLCTQNMLFEPVFRIGAEILQSKYKLTDHRGAPGLIKVHPEDKLQWVTLDWELEVLFHYHNGNLANSECQGRVIRCSGVTFDDKSTDEFKNDMNTLLQDGKFELR